MCVCVCVCVCVCLCVCVCVYYIHSQRSKARAVSSSPPNGHTCTTDTYVIFFKKKVYVTFLCYICTTDTYVSATDTYVDINTYVDVDFNTYM